jgi:hypothetical protein
MRLTKLGHHVGCVVQARPEPEVSGVDASPVVAGVQHLLALGYEAILEKPGYLMSVSSPTVPMDLAISASGSRTTRYNSADPFVTAVASHLYLFGETLGYWSSSWHA